MFKSHKQIPPKFRRVIIDETLTKRVSKIPLAVCNDIIARHLEEEQENETLKNFQVEYYIDGKHGCIDVVGRQEALIEVDRLLSFGENKDPTAVIAVRQAKRLIQGYVNCEWIYPEPRDKIRYVSRT